MAKAADNLIFGASVPRNTKGVGVSGSGGRGRGKLRADIILGPGDENDS